MLLLKGETLRGVLVGKKGAERIEPLPVRILLLSQNDISTLEPQMLEHVQYLRDLHLDNNPLVIDANFTAALHHLAELKVGANNVVNAKLEEECSSNM